MVGALNEDHPRTRGEKKILKYLSQNRRGSPPHTRGKVFHSAPCNPHRRITPAHAGKSAVYGDNQARFPGSPPHTRGKDISGDDDLVARGITPAHAGKSIIQVFTFLAHGDHPRTRGEKKPRSEQLKSDIGSPPHTRGKGFSFLFT